MGFVYAGAVAAPAFPSMGFISQHWSTGVMLCPGNQEGLREAASPPASLSLTSFAMEIFNSTGFSVGLKRRMHPHIYQGLVCNPCCFVFQKSRVLHCGCALCNPGLATSGNPEELGQPALTLCWVLCRWQVGSKQLKGLETNQSRQIDQMAPKVNQLVGMVTRRHRLAPLQTSPAMVSYGGG